MPAPPADLDRLADELWSSVLDRHPVWATSLAVHEHDELLDDRLREEARRRLGESFELAEFHDALLRHGGVPLSVLGFSVSRWLDGEAGA